MSLHPIYASTAAMARQFPDFSQLLADFTTAGIDRIELGWGPPMGELALPSGLKKFRSSWLVHNYFPPPREPFVLNLAAQDSRKLSQSREFAAAAIRLSAEVGAPFYSVHCGFLAEFGIESLGRQLSYEEICPYEQGYSTFVASLKFLIGEARTAGIELLVEPNVVAPGNLVEGRNRLLMLVEPNEFSRLFVDLPDPELGILLDFGHLKVTAKTLGFSADEFVDTVATKTRAFHLHDNNGLADQHRPVAADSWALNVLRQTRFKGLPVVVEAQFERLEALVEHCAWLKNLFHN